MSHDRFISNTEIANRMRVHPSSVKRIFANSDGPQPVRIGCRDKFQESKFEAWLRAQGAAD